MLPPHTHFSSPYFHHCISLQVHVPMSPNSSLSSLTHWFLLLALTKYPLNYFGRTLLVLWDLMPSFASRSGSLPVCSSLCNVQISDAKLEIAQQQVLNHPAEQSVGRHTSLSAEGDQWAVETCWPGISLSSRYTQCDTPGASLTAILMGMGNFYIWETSAFFWLYIFNVSKIYHGS